jgi:hypothetical protein
MDALDMMTLFVEVARGWCREVRARIESTSTSGFERQMYYDELECAEDYDDRITGLGLEFALLRDAVVTGGNFWSLVDHFRVTEEEFNN